KKSTIPNLPDLESFFDQLYKDINKINRREDYSTYIATTQANARAIREKILKYLMVRRTRTDIVKYFSKDLENQGLKFPKVAKPEPLYYLLDDKENDIFEKTVELIANNLSYARYKPMTYYTGEYTKSALQGQINLGLFMKILLVKRLESSFFAFKNSVDRFLKTYNIFIEAFKEGHVYTSKAHSNKVLEYLDKDDDESIQKLVEQDKAEEYDSKDFLEELLLDLEKDRKILDRIKELWKDVNRDPK
ncbi:uncharacterized protein METZ01_LOCUS470944, partial [marine metagenome]